MPTVGFSRANSQTYEAFRTSAAYSATLKLLQPRQWGLKGYTEFYRPLVARLRQQGVQPSGVWKGRWRSFHTGHQGAIYGTGLDDGKEQVYLSFRGPGSIQRFRALLSHHEEIEEKLKETVSWLDESHGGLRTTLLLERDNAFSFAGREEDLEATRVWMADSLLALKDAVQPHLNRVMEADLEPPSPPP